MTNLKQRWIIETHSSKIERAILDKFKKCGFKERLIEVIRPKEVKLYLFKKLEKIK